MRKARAPAPTDIVLAAMDRAGFKGRQKDFCRMAGVHENTFIRWKNKGSFPTDALRRMNLVAPFTADECMWLIRGE